MSTIEQLRFGAFVAFVALVYCLAAGIVLRAVLKRPMSTRPAAVWFRRIVLGAAGFGTLCILYGFFVEPYWPEVTRVRIASPKIPRGTRPIRIVQLSDLHCDAKVRLEERLPALIAAERPDVIVFTGDAINSPAGLPNFRRCMSRLTAIAPTFAVRGNWDVWYWSDQNLFGETGVRELRGAAEPITVAGVEVFIAGVPVESEGRIGAVLSGIPDGAFSILLHHYPDEILEAARRGADLYLAGHVHGGQIALPWYGALITLSRFGKRFESGTHRVGATWLHVNRGIGMEGGIMPRVRFCARPEVTVIELVPSHP